MITDPKRDLRVRLDMVDQNPSEPAVHKTAEKARAGETSGVMRYVLGISLVLAVVILSLVVWGPVLLSGK
jgi:hypothetical protein